jgi:hypothetical protein
MADYTITDMQFREVVRDEDNYLAEASIGIRIAVSPDGCWSLTTGRRTAS